MICPNCQSSKHARCCARCGKPSKDELCSSRCMRAQHREDRVSALQERASPTTDAGPARRGDKTSELKLRATPELKARIVAECERLDVSVSAWITWLAERELATRKP